MPKLSLYSMDGKKAGDITVSDKLFAAEINKEVMHTAVINYLANQRQGTQSALTRSEVSGGGKKPWRQKGTGRARQGSTRSPQWTHGGVVFAPKPRDYGFKVNKKVKQAALFSALSSKVAAESIYVVDSIALDEIKTSQVAGMIKNLGVSSTALVVTRDSDEKVYKSARNIEGVKAATATTLNTYELLKYDALIISKDAVEKLEEVYA